jgi:hypothetical protein
MLNNNDAIRFEQRMTHIVYSPMKENIYKDHFPYLIFFLQEKNE